MSRRLSYTADLNEIPTLLFNKNFAVASGDGRRSDFEGSKIGRKPACSRASFLNRIGSKVARAFRFVAITRSSRKVSSSTLVRSRSYAEPLDSHRVQALEDCIEFLNSSSSSLLRSNSVSTNS